jgi:acyl-CoA synthetase (AMP-forming)/AMP-acid ligase II
MKEKAGQLDEKELKAFLKKSLAPYKVPKQYIVLDELPKAPTGKPLKRELKKKVRETTVEGK